MKYLFISSEDSLKYNPTNSTYEFTVTLPQTIHGDWEIALSEIEYASHFEDMYVFCDLCESSYVKDKTLPLLRVVSKMGVFQNLYFYSVTRKVIQRIRVFIRNKDLETPSQSVGPIRLTLVMRQNACDETK